MVSIEKLGFRDERYSRQHRKYGSQMYMYDIDSIEYTANRQPAALIELKHGEVRSVDLGSHQMQCQRNTADKLEVPYFVVVYYPPGLDKVTGRFDPFGPHWAFLVIPANQLALEVLPPKAGAAPGYFMSELGYVEFLHYARGESNLIEHCDRTVLDAVLDRSCIKPPRVIGSV